MKLLEIPRHVMEASLIELGSKLASGKVPVFSRKMDTPAEALREEVYRYNFVINLLFNYNGWQDELCTIVSEQPRARYSLVYIGVSVRPSLGGHKTNLVEAFDLRRKKSDSRYKVLHFQTCQSPCIHLWELNYAEGVSYVTREAFFNIKEEG